MEDRIKRLEGLYEKAELSSLVWVRVWGELYKCFSERMQQEELDLMDSVLQGAIADEQEEILLRKYPHLASEEVDNREI